MEPARVEALRTLSAATDGNRALVVRARLELAFGPAGDRTAHARRVTLDALCAERVMPAWTALHPEVQRPARMLALAQQVIAGSTDRSAAELEHDDFFNEVDEIDPRDPEGRSACAGMAAIKTLSRALIEEDDTYGDPPPDIEDEDLDVDAWDVPYWASLATTGGLEGEPDPEIRREFWRWYLDEAVPRAANQT